MGMLVLFPLEKAGVPVLYTLLTWLDSAGPPCDDALNYCMLRCHQAATLALLLRPENRVSLDGVSHALMLASSMQYKASCTFTFTGLGDPVRQFMWVQCV